MLGDVIVQWVLSFSGSQPGLKVQRNVIVVTTAAGLDVTLCDYDVRCVPRSDIEAGFQTKRRSMGCVRNGNGSHGHSLSES